MSSVRGNVKRVNKKNEIPRKIFQRTIFICKDANGNIKTAINRGRSTRHTAMSDKNKKDSDKATIKTHSNSGVIGSKQLQSIYNLVGDVRQRSKLCILFSDVASLIIVPGDGKENQEVVPRFVSCFCFLHPVI